jgi:hypothetical protein
MSVLGSIENGLSDAGGFLKGAFKGGWDGLKGTVSGIGSLAEDGYKLATDSHYREQVWNSAVNDAKAAANFAQTAVTDPGKAADEIGNTATHAWHALETAYNQAAARGQGSEFIGQIFGQGAVLVGTAFIPGGAEAEAVGNASRATALLGDAEKLVDAGKAAAITGDFGNAAAIEDVSKAAAAITQDLNKATAAITQDASRAAAAVKDGSELGTAGEAEKPVQITLRGVDHTIPDWHMQDISYTKRTDAAREALRAEFPPVRRDFVKDLAGNRAAALREAGMSDADIALMAKGRVPSGYQVHHLLPLDDGGTNATSNLVLIKNDPDHMLITRYQIEQTEGMSAGQTRKLEWPMPDSQVSVWPETPDGGAYPTKH